MLIFSQFTPLMRTCDHSANRVLLLQGGDPNTYARPSTHQPLAENAMFYGHSCVNADFGLAISFAQGVSHLPGVDKNPQKNK
jgi:hypothetical protein